MKRSIIVTFIVSFLVTFVIGYTLLIAMADPSTSSAGYMMGGMTGGDTSWAKIGMLLEISVLVAILFTAYNAWENWKIDQAYRADITRLTHNELPRNPELMALSRQLTKMQGELQKLSADNSVARAEVVEEERKRISRELHDSVSQELFAATMILSSVTDTKTASKAQIVTQTALTLKILHEAQNEMRALLLHLRPTELDGKTLVQGLQSLIEELSAKVSTNINYTLGEVAGTPSVEDNLFRMSQEVLSNTLRHAHAQNVSVTLSEEKGMILLSMADDGIGFDPEDTKAASYGLKNLQERALLLGGTCRVLSTPNHGTTVEIRVPKIGD